MRPDIEIRRTLVSLLVRVGYPLAGLMILYSALPYWEMREHWSILIGYTVLTIICTFAPVSTYHARLTLNNAILFSGILLYGSWIAVWCAILEILIVSSLVRSSVSKAAANAGQMLITVWVASLFRDWMFGAFDASWWVVLDLLLILIYWLANTCLVAVGISCFYQSPWLETAIRMVKTGTTTYMLLMLIGGLGARLVSAYGVFAFIPLIAQIVAISIVFHRYFGGMKKLEHLNDSFLVTLAASIDARDPYTHGHSYRVAHWAREISQVLGLGKAQVDEIYYGGILHDIGKIGIEDEILKKEGKLSKEEYAKIQQHPVIGYQIVRQAGVFDELLPAIRSHHERMDGKGYPDGLSGADIPLAARILAVSDAFDAMVSDRPYRKGLPVEVALERIEEASGTQFDANIAEKFVKIIRNYPPEEFEIIMNKKGHWKSDSKEKTG
ncbi:HD-GYP domain-containing protein [Brevibacillus massiliensis]|jgi:putative nucleotidyltransferase with HDIG domain|uniref:HD-GYP domain-containing protein n=1 Tax=Brevibacillus massiliensis TaxID=1118054 RepID=UPI0002F9D755|nr:HD-GYP domain-containing protein [Brevibacillus massiliensis]